MLPRGDEVAAGETASERKRCVARNRDGSACGSFSLPGSDFCFSHDPDRQAERAEARRRGGLNSAKVIRLRGLIPPRLMPIYDQLEAAMSEVHDGDLDPRRASAMASIARAMVGVLQAGELEERLRRLEESQHGDN